MKTTLTTSQAADILANDEYSSFTRAGAFALVEYLEELEESMEEDLDFDHVAIRCDWSEYASLEDFRNEYFTDAQQCREALNADEDADEDEFNELTCQFIEDCGTLIEFDGGIIVSSF